MKHFLLFTFALITLFSSCDQAAFSIKGEIPDAQNLSVYFDKVNPISRTNSIIAKGETNTKGQFALPLEATPKKGVYRVRLGAKSVYLILDGTEKSVNISGALKDLTSFDYIVTGSALSNEYATTIKSYISGDIKAKNLQEYMTGAADPLIAMMIGTSRFSDVSFANLHGTISKKMQSQYPDRDVTKEYTAFANGLQREYQRQQSLAKVKIGEMAPDISLPDVNGKTRKLSDLRGQVVLLDFWASWCGPCRRENPNVVRVYDKYNPKGFTVYSVSLDGLDTRTRRRYPEDQLDNQLRSQKQRWLGAIKKDNLKWDNHVSDLKKWESQAASTYGVTSIPRTFMIDRDGKIAAINPRRNLEEAVKKLI